jgi:LPS-assembly protein
VIPAPRIRPRIRCGAILLAAAALFCATALADAATMHRKHGKQMPSVSGLAHGNALLQADEAIYDTQANVVTAQGHVEIANDEHILLADSVSYDQNTNIVTASGHVAMLEADGNVIFGNRVTLSKDMAEGVVEGFSALIGPNGRFVAVKAERKQGRYLVAHRAVFTPCRVCAKDPMPLWQVKAYRIVHDNVKKEIVYRDATLLFGGVPVLYTPYFSTPDPSVKHRSGVLIPDFGSSTYLGTFVRVPVYLALSDSRDITLAPIFTSSAGVVLEGEYRERWGAGGMWLQGSVGYNTNAPAGTGPMESHLFGSGRIPITNVWRTGFDVQLTSNDTYLRRYDISNQDRLNSDLFIEGIDGRSRFAVTGYFFQGLRVTDVTGQIPVALPLIEYTYIPNRNILGGQFRFDTSGLALFRSQGEDDERASATTSWRLPFILDDGQLITFEALARGDVYHTGNALLSDPMAPKNSQTIARGLALASAEWRWPFVASSASGKTSYVVEPIVQLVASPYGGNSRGVPNEDSTSFEFTASNLFNLNPFPGYDRWQGGPHANAGMRVSAILPTGDLSIMVGEDYRLKASSEFPAESGLGGTHSDIVGQINVDFSPYIDLSHQFRINQQTGDIESNQIDLKARFGRSLLDLTYLSLPAEDLGTGTPQPRKEISLSTSIGIYGNWFLFGSAVRDIEQSEMRDERLGITYEDECFTASIGYSRKFTILRDLKPSSSILFHLGLLTTPRSTVGIP